jgi:hypothetical protein
MRSALLVMLGACGFQPAPVTSGDVNMPDARPDTPIDTTIAGAPCYVPDRTGLVMCLELDDTPGTSAADGSGRHHDATVANVATVTRDVPANSQAGRIISTSTIQADPSPDFDIQQLTLELWVHREGSPASGGGIYALIHNRAQYYMAIDENDAVKCIIEEGSNFTIATGPALGFDEWDFAACTYDGTNLCPYVVTPAGAQAGTCTVQTITINTGYTSGISIGSLTQVNGMHIDHLAGELDSARIFSRALTVHEICQDAGVTGC